MEIIFSVIIPVYNRATMVGHAIESILNQTFNLFEVIIVNDGSEDNIAEIITTKYNDSRIKLLSITHSGRCIARNTGIKAALGEYICFLDSDDVYFPSKLENHWRAIQKYNFYNAFCSEQFFSNKPRKYLNKKHSKHEYVYTFKDVIKDNPISLNQLCVKKEITPFFPDSDLDNAEDLYYFRALLFKHPIIKLNNYDCNVIEHENRSVNTIETEHFVSNNIKSLELFLFNHDVPQNVSKELRVHTFLLSANIILSKTKNKRLAIYYFKKGTYLSSVKYLLFYKALIKIIIKCAE